MRLAVGSRSLTHAADALFRLPAASLVPDDLYYHREVLLYTAEGRRIELLTISSTQGLAMERCVAMIGLLALAQHVQLLRKSVNLVTALALCREPGIPGLFPDSMTTPRPRRIRGKPGIFISARVVRVCAPRCFVGHVG